MLHLDGDGRVNPLVVGLVVVLDFGLSLRLGVVHVALRLGASLNVRLHVRGLAPVPAILS